MHCIVYTESKHHFFTEHISCHSIHDRQLGCRQKHAATMLQLGGFSPLHMHVYNRRSFSSDTIKLVHQHTAAARLAQSFLKLSN
jgi:hypothetical protein